MGNMKKTLPHIYYSYEIIMIYVILITILVLF